MEILESYSEQETKNIAKDIASKIKSHTVIVLNGDEEKIRTAKRLIRGSLFSYGFILCIDLILSLIDTLLS